MGCALKRDRFVVGAVVDSGGRGHHCLSLGRIEDSNMTISRKREGGSV